MTQDSPSGFELTFHAAAQAILGSCMELTLNGRHILVDCGLQRGSRVLDALDQGRFDFDASRLEAVVLTHAHVDHCGLLPKLVEQGFTGHIWCTHGTADLLEFMLADAGRIQEAEAEKRNHRAGQPMMQPLYTEVDALQAWRQSRGVDLGEWFEPAPGFRVRFWNATHIIGSASAEIEVATERGPVKLLFSGDIGPDNRELQANPLVPTGLDYIVCDSTYGNRTLEILGTDARRALLERQINAAMARGGNLVIPVFAQERTQELALDIIRLVEGNRIPGVPVFVDSPLASRATMVFARHTAGMEDIQGMDIARHPSIHYVEDVEQSKRLNGVSGAIILAASGMCEGGRIRHHLKHNLLRRDSTVLFVGFQTPGSLGRLILDGAPRVPILDEEISVRATIRRVDSYSSHADSQDLLAWIKARLPVSGALFLSPGDSEAVAGLEELVQADVPLLKIITPQSGERFFIIPGAPPRRLRAAREDAEEAQGPDWQNDYASFVANLKHEMANLPTDKDRRRALAEMRAILVQGEGQDGSGAPD